ncbi:MAG: SGNH/GDSL hydrolase family protein [candidate division Zixibacteria bacterium]|nr:SGNH/GDSL hydrolase family protein [candidate division Zixibacteria bacterium]
MISKSKNISKSNRNNKGIKTFILILSIPIFILFFEIVFAIVPIDTFFENRFFVLNRALDYPEVFKRDTNLFWKLRPSQVITSRFFENNEFKINSFGLRGEEVPKQSDKIRIVGLGNSCTFGWHTPENEIYLRQLEKLINADTTLPQVEIINAGVPGYTSFQGQYFFENHISALESDIVLMMFGWNDQWAAADNIPDKDQHFPSQFILDIQDFVSRLKIYRLLRKIILLTTEKPLAETIMQENQVYRVTFDDFYSNLNGIIKTAGNNKTQTIILTSPIPSLENYYPPGSKSNMHIFHNNYNNQARSLASNTETALIDVSHEFDNYFDLFDDAKMDPIHFNSKGHLVLAEQIYQYLKNNPDLLSKK